MLQNHPYVHILALDFSKAFDSLSHNTITEKLASSNLSDNIYNWFVNYLLDRGHKTKYASNMSSMAKITASVVQGSALGPVAFIINAADLHPKHPGNDMSKYADDCYLVVPSTNSNTVASELENVSLWASKNNLKLNIKKTQEMLVYKKSTPKNCLPPPIPGVDRNEMLNVLGVTFSKHLDLSDHVNNLVTKGNQCLYALKCLKSQGLEGRSLNIVCRATLLSQMTYASQSWRGFASFQDHQRLHSVVRNASRWGCEGGYGLPDLIDL